MRIAAAAVLIGMAAMGTAGHAGAEPRPHDSECIVAPYLLGCDGSGVPTGPEMPTGPGDPNCVSSPADPVCAGGPFAPPNPATPPPIGSGLPGSIMPDGMPYGSAPPPAVPAMPGGIPGMPGSI
ncbi:hypothetical protein [Mycolicibacterium goodii]|uniref:Intersectin-EH binding protein Ibp1 n=1 Tax=Mycolicibacterium goodii TaxID=134601 RepID=A0ABS6HMB4_MYCGD|nr:hypothetical protein [Mycolicibacterium goodii]MBU8823827.1 hypothetical protein [Mycolicibacterium goodii]MBU8831903.1 hypothetical protein [Mycolicibacterium goodii]MBU8836472.1 hypothetical protein [Mycolicibacterium goodii]ULN45442.1 hypothetical protein MI170_18970 [Mycolicibacterium goodii]